MRVINVKRNQTLFDISIQEYGDIGGVYHLIHDNNLNGMLDNLFEGQELKVSDVNIINNEIKKYVSSKVLTTGAGVKGEGIGFWAIGHDFIIN